MSAREVIAMQLMMIRRGNPDMAGPSVMDYRRADELIAQLKFCGFEIFGPAPPEGEEMDW